VNDVASLIALVREWLEQPTPPNTIGDLDTFDRRTSILRGMLGGEPFLLHADTTRQAIEQVAAAPPEGWRVVANQRGKINLDLPPGDDPALPGWHCYLRSPRRSPGRL
jgi:hypothetical protein